MFFETAVAKTVAGAVLAGGATLGVGVAVKDCPAGQEMSVMGCAKVTHHPSGRKGTGTHSAVDGRKAPSGVDLRDGNGNRTTSGLGPDDQFEWLGGKKPGKNGDGTLIEVKQVTTGKGGWGPLYEGWIPVKFTQIPSMFN